MGNHLQQAVLLLLKYQAQRPVTGIAVEYVTTFIARKRQDRSGDQTVFEASKRGLL